MAEQLLDGPDIPSPASSRGGRMPHDDAEAVRACGIWTSFRARRAEAKHLLGEAASKGVLLYDETPRALFGPRRRPCVAQHQDAAGKMGWIQPFGIAWVALNDWKRIGRIVAIPGPLCDFMSALETIRSKLSRDVTASTNADLVRFGHIRKTTYAFIFLTAAKESNRRLASFSWLLLRRPARAVIEGAEVRATASKTRHRFEWQT